MLRSEISACDLAWRVVANGDPFLETVGDDPILETRKPRPETPYIATEARNRRPENCKPKPETPNPKSQNPNPKPQTPSPKLETLNRICVAAGDNQSPLGPIHPRCGPLTAFFLEGDLLNNPDQLHL